MFITENGTQVGCLTDRGDGDWELRLAPKRHEDGRREPRTIVLPEPNALEYARLRTRMVTIDREMTEMFPVPEPPVIPDETDDIEKARMAADYADAVGEYRRKRRDYQYGEDTAPYANVLIEVIESLTGTALTLADLVPEAFQPIVCSALLQGWEAPLGGQVVPGASLPGLAAQDAPVPATEDPDETETDRPAPDSPEPERSSPPGTEPSDLSHLPS